MDIKRRQRIARVGMRGNSKVGSELVLENRTDVKMSKPKDGFPWHIEKLKTTIQQPHFFQCLFNNGVILMINFYIKDGYVYDSL